jgi:hypothetical protein
MFDKQKFVLGTYIAIVIGSIAFIGYNNNTSSALIAAGGMTAAYVAGLIRGFQAATS